MSIAMCLTQCKIIQMHHKIFYPTYHNVIKLIRHCKRTKYFTHFFSVKNYIGNHNNKKIVIRTHLRGLILSDIIQQAESISTFQLC